MGRITSTIPRYWPFALSLLAAACVSTPHLFESRFGDEYLSSRNGQLRYRLPVGWLNATNDAPSANTLIWLVRDDFTSTLAVREVVIDAETRRELERAGLRRVAELTLGLVSGERGAKVVQQPVPSTAQGKNVCTYEYVTGHPGDRVHVVLLDSGERVYEISALMTSAVSTETIANVVSLQEAFVGNILW